LYNGQRNKYIESQIDRHIGRDAQTNGRQTINKQTGRKAEKQTDRQKDIKSDRQRQAGSQTEAGRQSS
jgi:hypothetical protein